MIDPVLDFDQRSGEATVAFGRRHPRRGGGARAQAIGRVLETHAHADHLSGAPYIKLKTGAKVCIGEHIRDVQRIFRPVFNATDVSGDGSEFDRLFKDGEHFELGGLDAQVIYTPGHTPACVSYQIGDAVFVGDTMFMPDYGTARADFPGGDARTLYRSIKRMLALPPETRLFMCHDYKAPGRDQLRLGDHGGRGAGAQCACTRGRQRGRIRRDARGARRQALGAVAAVALDPGQYARRQVPAGRGQWRALSEGAGEAGGVSRMPRARSKDGSKPRRACP